MTLQKTESFVPLTSKPTTDESREFRVTVIPQSSPAHNFQPLEQAAFHSTESNGLNGKKHGEPRLTMQRDGDRITNIRIQCGCGQVMELACVYDAPKA